MPGTTRRVIVLTACAVYVKPDLSILVVDLGLTGLPNAVGIDTVRSSSHGSRSRSSSRAMVPPSTSLLASAVPSHSCAPAAVSPPGDTLGRSRGPAGFRRPRSPMYALLIPAVSSRATVQGGRRRVRIPVRPPSSSDVAASARCSTGSWPTRSPVRAGSPFYGARRAWARARCWVSCPTGLSAGTSRRAVGVESEMELAYAGLHQLCAPMLGELGRCPVRSATRSRRCSAAASAPRPTGSWWGWPR